jgi:uncharacterized protein YecE (DUF72 family)
MAKLKIGTAGWAYDSWVGPFYPKRLETREHLPYYSSFFNINEINAPFYNLPSSEMVKNWYERVPDNFRFFVKVWKEITHKIHEDDLRSRVSTFFDRFEPLNEKIKGFLFQFPPWFKYSEDNFKRLKYLIGLLPDGNLYFIEFRDDSWYESDKLSEIIDGETIILVTSYLEGSRAVYHPDQKFYYIRLIGDRSINIFNRVQRERKEMADDLRSHIDQLRNDSTINEIFIIVNNHFTGFAPETANELKKLWDLPVKSFSTQTSITDFF